jgi:hypothetical protein
MTDGRDEAARIDPIKYAVDSSAWIELERHAQLDVIWPVVVALIGENRLKSPIEVIGELRDVEHVETSEMCKRIAPYEPQIIYRRNRDAHFHARLGWLYQNYRRMCRTTSPKKRPADPYVVAMAERDGFVVVVQETLLRRPGSKIPHACDALGIRCCTLQELFEAERHLVRRSA